MQDVYWIEPRGAGYTLLDIAYLRRDPELVAVLKRARAREDIPSSYGELPRDMLGKSFEEACQILGIDRHMYLLDRETFEGNLRKF